MNVQARVREILTEEGGMTMDSVYYRDGFKYQTADHFAVVLPFDCPDFEMEPFVCVMNNVMYILEGYAWDGASGAVDTKSIIRGTLVHDAFHEAMRKGLIPQTFRAPSDLLFRQMCIEDKMMKWRAAWVYKAVRKLAAGAANPRNRKKIRRAP